MTNTGFDATLVYHQNITHISLTVPKIFNENGPNALTIKHLLEMIFNYLIIYRETSRPVILGIS